MAPSRHRFCQIRVFDKLESAQISGAGSCVCWGSHFQCCHVLNTLQEEQLPLQHLHLQVLINKYSACKKSPQSTQNRCSVVCDRPHYQSASNQLFSCLNWSGSAKPEFRAAFPRRDYCKSDSGSVTSRNKSWVSPKNSGRCREVQRREVRSQPSFQTEIKSEIRLKFRGWSAGVFFFLFFNEIFTESVVKSKARHAFCKINQPLAARKRSQEINVLSLQARAPSVLPTQKEIKSEKLIYPLSKIISNNLAASGSSKIQLTSFALCVTRGLNRKQRNSLEQERI